MSIGKLVVCGAAFVAAISAGTAGATVATVAPKTKVMFQAGTSKVPSWTTATVFQNFESSRLSTAFNPYRGQSGTLTAGGTWKETTTADYVSYAGGVLGTVPSKTLTALGTYSVSFSVPQQYMSFVLQATAVPAFDTSILNLVLGFANGTSQRYTSLTSLGINDFTKLLGGRVNFDMGGQSGITSFAIRGAVIDDMASPRPSRRLGA